MAKLKIDMPNDFNFVRGVRVCIADIACHFGFSGREVYQIESIVDELCNNAIEHGGAKSRKPTSAKNAVKIACDFKPGELRLAVSDKGGAGFNLNEVLNRNKQLIEESSLLCNLDKRGRGLIIIRRFVDELRVNTNKDGSAVEVVKKAKSI